MKINQLINPMKKLKIVVISLLTVSSIIFSSNVFSSTTCSCSSKFCAGASSCTPGSSRGTCTSVGIDNCNSTVQVASVDQLVEGKTYSQSQLDEAIKKYGCNRTDVYDAILHSSCGIGVSKQGEQLTTYKLIDRTKFIECTNAIQNKCNQN